MVRTMFIMIPTYLAAHSRRSPSSLVDTARSRRERHTKMVSRPRLPAKVEKHVVHSDNAGVDAQEGGIAVGNPHQELKL